jgi:hypothetical protein
LRIGRPNGILIVMVIVGGEVGDSVMEGRGGFERKVE